MRFVHSSFLAGLASLILIAAFPTVSKADDTLFNQQIMRIPVTFWDFIDNGNVDFKLRTTIRHPGSNLNLVDSTLDSEKKPVRNVPADSNYFVLNIARYYRPFSPTETTYVHADTLLVPARVFDTLYDTSADSSTIPPTVTIDTLISPRTVMDSSYVGDTTKIGDLRYNNARVDDSLQFIMQADSEFVQTITDTNTGAFRNDTFITPNAYREITTDFHPLNHRGLQTDTNTLMNGSFTTEIHNSFVYHGHELLSITSDDDSWTFINGHLAIDLGGPRSPTRSILMVDSLHLTVGQTYPIDIFHRQIEGGVKTKASSRLDIVTDLDFVNKRLGTADIIIGVKQNLNPARGAVMTMAIGKGVLMKLPSATANVVFKVFNASGRMMLECHTGMLSPMAGINLLGKLHPGAYFVKAQCLDRSAASLGNIVDKFIVKN